MDLDLALDLGLIGHQDGMSAKMDISKEVQEGTKRALQDMDKNTEPASSSPVKKQASTTTTTTTTATTATTAVGISLLN